MLAGCVMWMDGRWGNKVNLVEYGWNLKLARSGHLCHAYSLHFIWFSGETCQLSGCCAPILRSILMTDHSHSAVAHHTPNSLFSQLLFVTQRLAPPRTTCIAIKCSTQSGKLMPSAPIAPFSRSGSSSCRVSVLQGPRLSMSEV